MISSNHCLIGGGGSTQGAGVETLKVTSELVLFPLNCALSLLMAAFSLVESCAWARGTGVDVLCMLGYKLWWSWQAIQSPRQFPISVQALPMAVFAIFRGMVWSKPAPFLLIVHSHIGNGTSALVESSAGARGAGAGAWCGLRFGLEWSWQAGQSPGSFQSTASTLFPGISKHVHVQEYSLGFLQPLASCHLFSNQLRRIIFPVSDPRPGVPYTWFEPLTPWAHHMPLLFCILC